MKPVIYIYIAASALVMVFALSAWGESVAAAGGQSRVAPAASTSAPRAVLERYCVSCHNSRLNTAGLRLDELDLSLLADHADIGEKMVRKLRAGMMPPSGRPRPDPQTLDMLIRWLEDELDRTAPVHLPPPGLHRLNRAEYSNAIRDLLGLRVDSSTFLPSDDSSHGFDNMAGTLTVSPALIEAYLSAAAKISRLAIGRATAPTQVVFDAPADTAQNDHIEGLPFGTRGGMLVRHEFPAAGDYVFKILPIAGYFKNVIGTVNGEQLELTVDGERVKLFDWDTEIGTGGPGKIGETSRVAVAAGLHTVGVAFIATNDAPGQELNRPFVRSMNSPGEIPGYTFYPHVGQIQIEGPYDAMGAADSPSRRKIFVCYPSFVEEERACARQIIGRLARRAYRRPVGPDDLQILMEFYDAGRSDTSFDAGIEAALQRILADPEFVYRGEPESHAVRATEPYRIGDVELASRLSFFFWSSIPDDELLQVAEDGRLSDPVELDRQTRRMIADPRSWALVENFVGQWLNVRGLQAREPAVNVFPDFDSTLREAFGRETELFFDSIVREDRSILDLLTADYTFVNERLAKHYGIRNVYGSQFRRITLGSELDMRHGLLGKGALLTSTSEAARTAPVTRGKWFLQTFLGVSPPEPPPNVPAIGAGAPDTAGNVKEPTMRDQLAIHSTNPTCAACHRIFEPLGLALENYDATGAWRTEEAGAPIDATGTFVDGMSIDGPASLRTLLMRYSEQYVRNVTEKLLTYALGRGVEYQDMPLVRAIVREASESDYRFSALVRSIVRSDAFQMNVKTAATTVNSQGRPAAR